MYKIGDAILLNESFNLWKINTWLNPFVKFFINLWHKKNKQAYVNYSHAGIVAEYQGKLYMWEAVKDGFIPTLPIYERLKGVDHLILRPHFTIIDSQINDLCLKMEGTPYDYEGVTISSLFHQFTNETFWIELAPNSQGKKMYCIEAVCYIYNKTDSNLFQNWFATDQKDLYFNKNFQHIKPTV